MFKLFFSTIVLFVFNKNLNAAALECHIDDYLIHNLDVISINAEYLEVQPLISIDEIPSFISIRIDEDFSDRALSSKLTGKFLKTKINSNLYFYLKSSGNNYMGGFYVIKRGEFVTKLDTYCSFNMLSNYHSNFIQFEKGDL